MKKLLELETCYATGGESWEVTQLMAGLLCQDGLHELTVCTQQYVRYKCENGVQKISHWEVLLTYHGNFLNPETLKATQGQARFDAEQQIGT